jgi:hypothetical protein
MSNITRLHNPGGLALQSRLMIKKSSHENPIFTRESDETPAEALYFTRLTISQYTPAASTPLAGMVISHAVMISSATLQRTLLARSAEPTPMIAELTTCEVLTGTPKKDAARITPAELSWVAKLCKGRIL